MKCFGSDLYDLVIQCFELLDVYWMLFIVNCQYKVVLCMLVCVEGMYYEDIDGCLIFDGIVGLWCCNVGYVCLCIVEVIVGQVCMFDYLLVFQMGLLLVFVLVQWLVVLVLVLFNYVFFISFGLEVVDIVMKIVLVYYCQCGEGQCMCFISCEKVYYGVGFGGMVLGGLFNNCRVFGLQLGGVDYLCYILDLQCNVFSKGLLCQGVELVDDLEWLIVLYDVLMIVVVFVEFIVGFVGVILFVFGYLQCLCELCDYYGILLVFDEVIIGFGWVGMFFVVQCFGVILDLLIFVKVVSNGVVLLGGVLVSDVVYVMLMQVLLQVIELFYGYIYLGYLLVCVVVLVILDVYVEECLFECVIELGEYWQEWLYVLQGLFNVIDICNFGLVGVVELVLCWDMFGSRGYEVFWCCFYDG